MFDRIRNAFHREPPGGRQEDAVGRWATRNFLSHTASSGGAFSISGLLHGKPFRAECGASSRDYIEGLELRARVELDLPRAGHVIVMSRAVKRSLEKQANALYAAATDSLQTSARELPEEVRWLTLFRDAGWAGPPPDFWNRYAVLTDAVDLARRWLDDEAMDYLMAGASETAAAVPVMLMLVRGKANLRLQVNPHAKGADAALALELLEYLSAKALMLGSRAAPGDISSRA